MIITYLYRSRTNFWPFLNLNGHGSDPSKDIKEFHRGGRGLVALCIYDFFLFICLDFRSKFQIKPCLTTFECPLQLDLLIQPCMIYILFLFTTREKATIRSSTYTQWAEYLAHDRIYLNVQHGVAWNLFGFGFLVFQCQKQEKKVFLWAVYFTRNVARYLDEVKFNHALKRRCQVGFGGGISKIKIKKFFF